MKGLIIANGNLNMRERFELIVKESDRIICADGGANYLIEVGIYPDKLMGDLDSVDDGIYRLACQKGIAIHQYPMRKDFTDTELAINEMINEGISDITILAGIGSRWDHSIANLMMLYSYYLRGTQIKMIDEKNCCYILEGRTTINKDNCYHSLIPLSREGIIISLSGFAYDLHQKHISFGSTNCISNQVLREEAEINIHHGVGLYCCSSD